MKSKTFPGNYASLSLISKFVAEVAEDAGLDECEVYNIQLAVDEACTNIIEHAYGGEGKGDIICACGSGPDAFEIEIRDRGRSFDPNMVPAPDTDVPLEKVRSRGAGIYLMKKLMDEVSFDFSNGGETVLRLLKKIK